MNRGSCSPSVRRSASRSSPGVAGPGTAEEEGTGAPGKGGGNTCTLQAVVPSKQQVARCIEVSRPTPAHRRAVRSWTTRRPPSPRALHPLPHEETVVTTPPDDLRARLAGLTLEDEHRLRRRLDGTRKTRDVEARARQRARIAADVSAAEERIARRRAAVQIGRAHV